MATPREKHTKDGKIRVVSFAIAPEHVIALDEWADERRTNRSTLMREALDTYLRLHGRDPRQVPERVA